MLLHPLNTEKGMRGMQEANTLVFAVERQDTKEDIRKAVEEQFKVKVIGVRTQISLQGRKKAFVALSPDTPAIDVATKLGML
jgi:ribosomal protein uL23